MAAALLLQLSNFELLSPMGYRVDMMRDVHATDEGIAASKANALLRGS